MKSSKVNKKLTKMLNFHVIVNFIRTKIIKKTNLNLRFCKISQTYNCNQESDDHVCDIENIPHFNHIPSATYYNNFVYYCRNPEMPRKTIDQEYCRHAAISFINMFGKIFALLGFMLLK